MSDHRTQAQERIPLTFCLCLIGLLASMDDLMVQLFLLSVPHRCFARGNVLGGKGSRDELDTRKRAERFPSLAF